MGDIISIFFFLIPVFITAIALRWVRIIRFNSEKQIQQNEEIIGLLKEVAREGKL